MKNSKFYLNLFSILLISLVGCKKQNTNPHQDSVTDLKGLFFENSITTHGILWIHAYGGAYDLGANIFADTPKTAPVDAGTITIGNKSLTTDASSNYSYMYNVSDSDDPTLISIFGNTIPFEMTGNSSL